MYKSPIDIVYHDIDSKIDSEICKAVLACKIDVDKQELIKALAYDRQQYEKGYADATPHWISCKDRLPEKDGRYLVTCGRLGAWNVDWNIWHNGREPGWLWEQGVTAWMPLPAPWEGETDG